MGKNWLMYLICVGLSGILCTPAFALKFSPIYATLKPTGREKSFTFRAENPSDKKIAVEINIKHRIHDLEGKEENPSADDKFNVFPPQMVLKPKERRTVRITWLGKEKLEQEQAFRLVADQLPIKGLGKRKENSKAGIQILMRYVASVYVEPEGVEPKLIVKDSQIVEVKGKAVLELVVENSGKKHQLMFGPSLKVSYTPEGQEAKEIKLLEDDLKMVTESNILPSTARKYYIPWTFSKYRGPVKVSLNLKKEG